MSWRRILKDVFLVARREKKWWLLPLIVVLVLVSLLGLLSALSGPLAPFVYPLI